MSRCTNDANNRWNQLPCLIGSNPVFRTLKELTQMHHSFPSPLIPNDFLLLNLIVKKRLYAYVNFSFKESFLRLRVLMFHFVVGFFRYILVIHNHVCHAKREVIPRLVLINSYMYVYLAIRDPYRLIKANEWRLLIIWSFILTLKNRKICSCSWRIHAYICIYLMHTTMLNNCHHEEPNL